MDAIQGRGASGNPTNRFTELFLDRNERDEDWDEPESPRPKTQFFLDHSKSIISHNDSPDLIMAAGINPYRGCEHGCIYCFARPGHEYFELSAGLDFETKIFIKTKAPELLREALGSKKWKPQHVMMSGVTDCYQPVERRLQLTRRCLEVFLDFRNPVGIVTKNFLVTRDVDLLQELTKFKCVGVLVSVTTLRPELARVMEPRTAQPARRIEAIRILREAGVNVGVMVGPIIPGLTEEEVPSILKETANAGARFAAHTLLRLPFAVAPLFETWLSEHFPDRKEKILNRIRSMRGGRLNDPRFGYRMRGEGIFAEQVLKLFRFGCKKAGIRGGIETTTANFRNPLGTQLKLF